MIELAPAPEVDEVATPARQLSSTAWKPGRVKTGGRQKGVRNRHRTFTIERINETASPIEFLCRVVNGEAIEVAKEANSPDVVLVRPTMQDRLYAARALADKVLPDLKAVQYDGDAAPVVVNLTLAQGVRVSTGGPR